MQISISNAIGGGGGNLGSGGGSSFASTNSFTFDGIDDFINVGYIAELNNTSAFTFSGWYKQTTIDQFDALMEYFIDLNNSFGVYTYTDGNMYLQFQKSTNNLYGYFDYSTLISAGAWFNIVVVYNGSGLTNADKLKCYIDGTPVTLSFSGTQPTTTPAGINEFKIGRNDEYGVNWLGNTDEVALWNTDESANVSSIYNSGVPTNLNELSTPPLSWWRMGEAATYAGGAWTLVDQGSGSNNGSSTTLPPEALSTDVPT